MEMMPAEETAQSSVMMRAAMFSGEGQVRVGEVQRPVPGPGQVRIRLQGCGICASNIPAFEGRPWFEYPLQAGAPGHEGWGIVDALGPSVDTLRVGERVAMLSYHAYAEYDLASAEHCVVLPAVMDVLPFPGEALACAFNIFARSAIGPGDRVAIVGIGFLGTLLTRLASRAGAQVIAISRRNDALEFAALAGAWATLQLDDPAAIVERVREMTQARGCTHVIEAVGLQAPLDLATALTSERGRLVIAGYHQDAPRQVDMQLWNWRGLDVVNAHERDPAIYCAGMRAAIAAIESGELDPSSLYTHCFPLEGLGDAMRIVRDRDNGVLKALVLL